MNKAVVASLLAVSGMVGVARIAAAQSQVNLGSNAQATSGGVQMSPAEYKAYNDAITQTAPQAKAAALEAYLTAYPQSAVKADTLQLLMATYSAIRIRPRRWMQPTVCCRSTLTTCARSCSRSTSASQRGIKRLIQLRSRLLTTRRPALLRRASQQPNRRI